MRARPFWTPTRRCDQRNAAALCGGVFGCREEVMSSEKEAFGPIVSSGHLASGALPALSEIEFGMIMLNHALSRWKVRCIQAAGMPDLTPLHIVVLHNTTSTSNPKPRTYLALYMQIAVTHVLTYTLTILNHTNPIKS